MTYFSTNPIRLYLCLSCAVIAILATGCKASKFGMEAYNKGDYQTAHDYLYEAILQEKDLDPTVQKAYVETVIKLVDGYSAQGKYDSALALLDEATELERDNVKLRNARIKVHLDFADQTLKERNLEISQSNVNEALRMDPSNERARKLRGRIKIELAQIDLRQGEWRQALERYDQYLKDFPDDREIKREAAKVFVSRGDELTRRRQFKPAMEAYSRALVYIPEFNPAISAALRAADEAGGGLSENYRFLVAQAPQDRKLRRLVVEQLRRRASDHLDSDDPSTALKFTAAAYELDIKPQLNINAYRDIVLDVVDFQFERGNTQQAAQTLREAGKKMPPLAQDFQNRADEMISENKKFYRHLEDDVNYLNRLTNDLNAALVDNDTIDAVTIRKGNSLSQAMVDQRESLNHVKRQENRRLLDQRAFNVPIEEQEVLAPLLGENKSREYQEFLKRYTRSR